MLTLMTFLGLVMAYAMRLSLSVAITQMVPPPIISTNLTSTIDEPICPYTDENYIHEHYDYQSIFDSLYNSVRMLVNDLQWCTLKYTFIAMNFWFNFSIRIFLNLHIKLILLYRITMCTIGHKNNRV